MMRFLLVGAIRYHEMEDDAHANHGTATFMEGGGKESQAVSLHGRDVFSMCRHSVFMCVAFYSARHDRCFLHVAVLLGN